MYKQQQLLVLVNQNLQLHTTWHLADQLPSRNVALYYEMPIYRRAGDKTLPGRIYGSGETASCTTLVDSGGKLADSVTVKN